MIITDESDVYFDHVIVTVAPHYEASRCGCNTWSKTVPHVSSYYNIIMLLSDKVKINIVVNEYLCMGIDQSTE